MNKPCDNLLTYVLMLAFALPCHVAGADESDVARHVAAMANQQEVDWLVYPAPAPAPPILPGTATAVLDASLSSGDARVRLRALEGLASQLPAEHIESFVQALADPSPEVGQFAAQSLRGVDPGLLYDRVVDFFSQANLSEMNDSAGTSLPLLREVLNEKLMATVQSADETSARRGAAAFCLGKMSIPAAAQPLASVAWGNDVRLSVQCVHALAATPEPSVVTYLFELAAHPAPEVRLEALRMLTGLSGPEAVAAVGRIAIERPANDAALSKLAVEAITQLPDVKISIPLLIETMRRNLSARREAGVVLRKMTGQHFGDIPSDWQAWWDKKREELENPPAADEASLFSITYM